jgi:hypothetical protein
MKTLFLRFISETPAFFKKLQLISFSIGSTLTALLAIDMSFSPDIITYMRYGLAICIAITGTSQFAKVD